MAEHATEAAPVTSAEILQALRRHSRELRDLSIGDSVSILDAPLDPLQFLHKHVSPNKPALIHGAVDHWPALHCWTNEYLISATGNRKVTVACTPDGRADAICNNGPGGHPCFALPHERRLPLAQVLLQFEQAKNTVAREEVWYAQAQNDSLKQDFPGLIADVDEQLSWATAAFGQPPDAVNLWLGNHQSVTSFHRDHYENIYIVVSGTKKFTLLPPSDRFRMHMMEVPVAQYCPGISGLQLVPQIPESTVSWCPLDPDPTSSAEQGDRASPGCFALYHDSTLPKPLVVEVHAGQALYLPSMWYHMVQQQDDDSGRVIAVNYWYDMQFDCKYAYAQLIEQLSSWISCSKTDLERLQLQKS